MAFAAAGLVLYLLIDGGSTALFGYSLSQFFTLTVLISMAAKALAAFAGAFAGSRRKEAAA
jgi:hypothetical protein